MLFVGCCLAGFGIDYCRGGGGECVCGVGGRTERGGGGGGLGPAWKRA